MMKDDKEQVLFFLSLVLSFVKWRPHEYGNQLLFGGGGTERDRQGEMEEDDERCLMERSRSPKHLLRGVSWVMSTVERPKFGGLDVDGKSTGEAPAQSEELLLYFPSETPGEQDLISSHNSSREKTAAAKPPAIKVGCCC